MGTSALTDACRMSADGEVLLVRPSLSQFLNVQDDEIQAAFLVSAGIASLGVIIALGPGMVAAPTAVEVFCSYVAIASLLRLLLERELVSGTYTT